MTPPTKEAPAVVEDDDELEFPERAHSVGCPMNDERLEWFEVEQVTGKDSGKTVRVVRCCDCGGEHREVLN